MSGLPWKTPSPKSKADGNGSANGFGDGATSQEAQDGWQRNSTLAPYRSSTGSAVVVVSTGVPCAIVSAAFRGPSFVAGFQRALVEKNLGLAERLAQYFSRPSRSRVLEEDLRSAAYEGLCTAALRYAQGGASFAHYARFWIRREIFRRIATGDGPVSRPRNAVERARALRAYRDQLAQEHSSEISDEELAERLIPPAPSQHGRTRSETPTEIRSLENLLHLSSCEVLPDDLHASWEPRFVSPLPPVSPLLKRILEGEGLGDIAGGHRPSRTEIRSRIAAELRRFFRQ